MERKVMLTCSFCGESPTIVAGDAANTLPES